MKEPYRSGQTAAIFSEAFRKFKKLRCISAIDYVVKMVTSRGEVTKFSVLLDGLAEIERWTTSKDRIIVEFAS